MTSAINPYGIFGRDNQEEGDGPRATPVATTLPFNGCPIGHIREILGHGHLVTTCKYYLAADKRAAKSAHAKYLDYAVSPEG